MYTYKEMYYFLFNAVTDALEYLPENVPYARLMLKMAQIRCEKMYIENEEEEDFYEMEEYED